jgi:hypothetical protein
MPDNKEETEILVQGDGELLEATDLLDKDEPTEEVEVSIDAEDLKPKPAEKRAPRGIETFTVCRQNDEGGISGTGVVIEGVLFATSLAFAKSSGIYIYFCIDGRFQKDSRCAPQRQ